MFVLFLQQIPGAEAEVRALLEPGASKQQHLVANERNASSQQLLNLKFTKSELLVLSY